MFLFIYLFIYYYYLFQFILLCKSPIVCNYLILVFCNAIQIINRYMFHAQISKRNRYLISLGFFFYYIFN